MTRSERERRATLKDWTLKDWKVTGHATPVKRVERAPRPVAAIPARVSGRRTTLADLIDRKLAAIDARRG